MKEKSLFPESFSVYLEANGWRREDIWSTWTSFRRNDMRLYVKDDWIEVFILTDDNPRRPGRLLCSFRGWQVLNDFTFMLLMHTMNVVSIKQFTQKVRREFGPQAASMEELLLHFKTELLPEAY